jgi:succinoglycan biosynthesis transport protein ExoP
MVRSSENTPALDGGFVEDFREERESDFEQIDLQHYVRILRKYKLLIVLFSALITCLAAYYAFTATPVYSATSTILIESQSNSPISFEELVGVEVESQDYYQTQYELLRSRGLAKRVVDTLNLWAHPELSGIPAAGPADVEPTQPGVVGGFLESVTGAIDGFINQGAEPVVVDLNNPVQTLPDTSIQTEIASNVLQNTAISNNGLNKAQREMSGAGLTQAEQRVLGGFMARLSISPVRKTKLVQISFQSTDPEFAALVANTVGEQYIESYLDAKLELTTTASTWLNTRLTELKAILDKSENRLIAFKEENGLVDVGGSVGRLNEQELLLVTAELSQARSDLSVKEDLYREVQSLQSQPELLDSIPAIQSDGLVQNVKIDQGQAQRNLDELRNRYGNRHPRVIDANSQLTTLNVTLEGQVARVVSSIAKNYQLAQQRVAAVESKLRLGKSEIQAIGTKKFELDALEREAITNRSIYDTFFSRITEAKSADGLEAANARISDYALPPLRPFKPKKQLIVALAALGSLVCSMLLAFLYEQMDDTVKGTNDIEKKIGLKLLGILPLVKTGIFSGRRKLPLSPLEISDNHRTFSEAVKTARTAICLGEGADQRKVIVITSSVPGEGKSTASVNLAYSLAQMERVLLIDCDMRRPSIAKSAGLDRNAKGLSNLIAGDAVAKQCIVHGAFDGAFDILPSGNMADHPLELLSSKRFEKILEQLAKYYDRVIIDSAPTQAVSDALVLARLSDAVVYVIKSHDTSMELVKRGVQRLRQVRAPLVGVLVTQVDIDKITTYGGDYYYQGYYDYYGYVEDGAAKNSESTGATRNGKLKLSQAELLEIQSDDREVNLDLDYGMPSSLRADNDFDEANDFDFTTRIDRPKSKPVATSGRRRNVDDLDIL